MVAILLLMLVFVASCAGTQPSQLEEVSHQIRPIMSRVGYPASSMVDISWHTQSPRRVATQDFAQASQDLIEVRLLAQEIERTRRRRMLFDAISACRDGLSEERRWQIADSIDQKSREHGYDPLFVQALVEIESTCTPTALSIKGAVGLIQVLPSTGKEAAEDLGVRWRGGHMLKDPAINLDLGLYYLSKLEDRFGDRRLAVAAYNLGPARVSRMRPADARRASYVRKVFGRYEDLQKEHLS